MGKSQTFPRRRMGAKIQMAYRSACSLYDTRADTRKILDSIHVNEPGQFAYLRAATDFLCDPHSDRHFDSHIDENNATY